MRTVAENLEILYNSVQNIKQAITEKGGDVSGDITTWGNVISSIGSESGEVKPTANLILNKLNGATIGNSNTLYSIETLLYTYTFDDNVVDKACFPLNINYTNDKGFSYAIASSSLHGYEKDYYGNYGYHLSYYDCINAVSEDDISYNSVGNSDLNINALQHGSGIDSAFLLKQKFILLCIDNAGNYDYDTFIVTISKSVCYIKDTNISLSNGMTKSVQDITYNDALLVWNFDEGKFDKAKPLWIKKEERTNNYYKVTLDDGNTIGLVGSNGRCHRLFDYDDMVFESATELVGKNVHTLNGIHKVVSVENIQEEVEYYNIITDFHMNCFANGMLTSCRYNNLYPIKDMVFDKSTVELEPRWKINQEKFIPNPEILPKYVKGMRLAENTTITVDEMKDYINNLENRRKTILDFNSNEMLNNIENTEVGWIDRDGKSYGFKLYMPGQNNHINLADKICKELNIETDNPSRYLEKEGWVKYTTDFVLNSDDKEINDAQLKSLQKFLKVPNKLKKDGKIRIGNCMSPHVDISEFDNMNIYSFEYRKKHGRK